MFPPQLPRVLIEWLSQENDLVYDPFSGRGTAAFEAVLAKRRAWAADANPLAVALSRAKVSVPSLAEVQVRLEQLRDSYIPNDELPQDVSPDVRMLYSPATLAQLIYLKNKLSNTRVDALIIAMVLGMLHANHSTAGATRGFSISMPNTFAMSPNYVRDYIRAKGLEAPDVDVFYMLGKRATALALPSDAINGGCVWQADATTGFDVIPSEKARLLLSSPPYLQVIKYGKYNWVRLWFLGQDARSVDQNLTATKSLRRYFEFLGKSLDAASPTLTDDAIVALVIGDVRKGEQQLKLAELVEANVSRPKGWNCLGIVVDDLPVGHKVSPHLEGQQWTGNDR